MVSRERAYGGGRCPKYGGDRFQENLCALGSSPRKRALRKWFVHEVEALDAYNWITAAKNEGKWNLRVDSGVEEFEA